MKLTNIDFIRLLPQFMRNDDAVKGFAAGIDSIVPGLALSIKKLSTWDRIDDLTEAELDALAWELNILWYDTGANIDIKRELIKNSDLVYKHLGTKWAVENVIRTYFGEGYIKEWFEYEGSPGHFKVFSANPTLTVTEEKFAEFLYLLSKVKRATAKLDGVYITLTGAMPLSAGFAIHEVGAEEYPIGSASDII